MKWYKHDSDASMDAKLQEILLDYGLEGYGLYWYCLELITAKVDNDNVSFSLEHDCRIIARNTGSTAKKVQEIMASFIELGLFESTDGVVTCLKLAKRLDKSMTSNANMRSIIGNIRNNHDSVMTKSDNVMIESAKVMQDKNRIEENRLDKKRVVKDLSSKDDGQVVARIFNHWLSVMNKSAASKLTPKRRTCISARLKEGYSESQILQAIDGCSRSSHHMGKNDQGTVYDCLTLICRSGDKLEWFINNIGSVRTTADTREQEVDDWVNDVQSNDFSEGETFDHGQH